MWGSACVLAVALLSVSVDDACVSDHMALLHDDPDDLWGCQRTKDEGVGTGAAPCLVKSPPPPPPEPTFKEPSCTKQLLGLCNGRRVSCADGSGEL